MLAVKYRPKKITDLVGQPHIQKVMKGLLFRWKETGILANCILLHGSLGAGKTTSARLLARYLNCQKGPLKACGTCPSCEALDKDAHPSVIELDAASNRGIDQVRQLQTQLTFRSPYPVKVIILDECHQLTKEAASALLKTLEEGCQDTIFILCTTEVDKVLDTIVSRCLSLQVNNIPDEDLLKRLTHVARIEKIVVTSEALDSIVSLSRGHCRDALQLLESSWLYSNRKEIKAEAVLACSGYSSLKRAREFVTAFVTHNTSKLLELIRVSPDDPVQLIKTILVVIGLDLKDRFMGRRSRWEDLSDEQMIELNSLFMHANFHFQQSRFSLFVLKYWLECWKGDDPMGRLSKLR